MSRSSPSALLAAAATLALPATLFAQAARQGAVISADTAIRLDMAAALAADPAPAPQAPGGGAVSPWHFSISANVWAPAIKDGKFTVGGAETSADVSLGDAFSHLGDNWSAGFHLELPLGRFTVFGDFVYIDASAEGTDAFGSDATSDFTDWIFEFGAAYTAIDTHPPTSKNDPAFRFVLEPLIGLRAHVLDQTVSSSFTFGNQEDKRWIDAIIGVRGRIEFAPWVGIFGRADIGGGGSDLTWNAVAGVDFRFDPAFSLQLGYRILSVDFSEGSGFDEFKFDVLMHGPYLGITFRF